MLISEKWNSLSIDQKMKILSENYPLDFLLNKLAFLDFCKLEYDSLSDRFIIIKNVIIKELSKEVT